jgi:hypothetical protein
MNPMALTLVTKGHQKSCTHLRQYMGDDYEMLQEEHTITTFGLISHRCLELILNPTPPPSTQLCCTWALGHVKEYA